MRLIGYYRGGPHDAGRSVIEEYAAHRGAAPELIACDGPDDYRALRGLQNAAKLAEDVTILMPSYSHLGSDRYMCLENELFFRRNGTRLVFADGSFRDPRHDAVLVTYLYFKGDLAGRREYGSVIPYPEVHENSLQKTPIGYANSESGISEDPVLAPVIRAVFEAFAKGVSVSALREMANALLDGRRKPFTNTTVYTALRNSRYLGLRSKQGTETPPIINLAQWFAARERDPIEDNDLRARCILRERLIGSGGEAIAVFTADKLIGEAILCAAKSASNCDTERLFKEYVRPELERAKQAEERAAHELRLSERGFKRDMAAVSEGSRSEKLQSRLELRADERVMLARRLRRIRREIKLLSLPEEQAAEFFSRAAAMKKLSFEETAFMLPAFIRGVDIRREHAYIYYGDLESGKLKRHTVKL